MEQPQEQYYAGTSHEPRDHITGIVEDFFGGDIMSTQGSLIPPHSQSQYVLHTPSPTDDTRIEDEEQ
jgi:hypothetical protein